MPSATTTRSNFVPPGRRPCAGMRGSAGGGWRQHRGHAASPERQRPHPRGGGPGRRRTGCPVHHAGLQSLVSSAEPALRAGAMHRSHADHPAPLPRSRGASAITASGRLRGLNRAGEAPAWIPLSAATHGDHGSGDTERQPRASSRRPVSRAGRRPAIRPNLAGRRAGCSSRLELPFPS